jgi:hypothetical protein
VNPPERLLHPRRWPDGLTERLGGLGVGDAVLELHKDALLGHVHLPCESLLLAQQGVFEGALSFGQLVRHRVRCLSEERSMLES